MAHAAQSPPTQLKDMQQVIVQTRQAVQECVELAYKIEILPDADGQIVSLKDILERSVFSFQ